jgi:hypothetical protein
MAEAHADFETHRGLQILYQFCKKIEKFLAEETATRLEECDDLVQDLPFLVHDKYKMSQVISDSQAKGDATFSNVQECTSCTNVGNRVSQHLKYKWV